MKKGGTCDIGARGIRARCLLESGKEITGMIDTTRENIQDWFEVDEGDTAFRLLIEEENCCSDTFSVTFIRTIYINTFFPFTWFRLFFFCL
jgi:hypothetical protein